MVFLILISKPKSVFKLWPYVGILGFLIGCIPFIICTLTDHGHNLTIAHSVSFLNTIEKMKLLIIHTLPALGGIWIPTFIDNEYWLRWATPLQVLGIGIWVVAFVGFIWVPIKKRRIKFLLYFYLLFVLYVAAHTARTHVKDVRYLLNLTIVFIPVLSGFLAYFYQKKKYLVLFSLGILIVIHLLGQVRLLWVWHIPQYLTRTAHISDYKPVIKFINKHQIDGVYAHYWFSYPLTFLMDEKTVFSPPVDERFNRYRPYYLSQVETANNPAILAHDSTGFSSFEIQNGLQINHLKFKQKKLGDFTLFYHFQSIHQGKTYQILPTKKLNITSTVFSENIHLMSDNDLSTYWSTNKRQQQENEIQIELDQIYTIGAISLDHGQRIGDYPRIFTIQASIDGNQWHQIFQSDQINHLIALKDHHLIFQMSDGCAFIEFPATKSKYLKLIQGGESHRFNWSVAELRLFALNQ